MHIGFLTPEYVTFDRPEGGLANYLRKVALGLTDLGHRVSVLVISDKNAFWQDRSVAVTEVKRFVWSTRLKQIRYPRNFLPVTELILSSRRLAKAVWRIHSETPFDLLHTSSYRAPGFALRNNGRIPMVCRISSYSPLLRSACGHRRSLGDHLCDWLEIRQVLDAEDAFVPSDYVAEILVRFEAFRPQVIRSPLDMQSVPMDFSYYDAHLAGQQYLLYFGALNLVKGIDYLCKVVPEILSIHRTIRFVFIGRDDGFPNGENAFEVLRARCGAFVSHLHYSPALPKALLYPVIAGAAGVVMPSRVDNYPNACLEAQALGIPVVGNDRSSLEEMIVDGKTGYLARNGDVASLKTAILKLLAQSPDDRIVMREELRTHIKSIQEEDRLGQLVSFYDSVVTRFRGH